MRSGWLTYRRGPGYRLDSRYRLGHEALVALLCAVIALGSIASVRLATAKAFDAGHLALCLPSGTPVDDTSGEGHDCGTCCLPSPVAIPGTAPKVTLRPLNLSRLAMPEPVRLAGPAGIPLPWSTGPPRAA